MEDNEESEIQRIILSVGDFKSAAHRHGNHGCSGPPLAYAKVCLETPPTADSGKTNIALIDLE